MIQTVKAGKEAQQVEKWISENEARTKFGDDLDKHVTSGRVVWRECPWTAGVYEYKDCHDITSVKTVRREKGISHLKETDVDDEDGGKAFDEWFDSVASFNGNGDAFLDTIADGLWTAGEGKGVLKGTGKGGKNGKTPPTPSPVPAIEDMSEEDKVWCKKTLFLKYQYHYFRF